MTRARSHALAYLQLLARLDHPDEQAQADILTAVQLAQGGESDEKLSALAERLFDLNQQALSALSSSKQSKSPSRRGSPDEVSFNNLGRRVIDLESLRPVLRSGETALLAWVVGPEESYLLQVSQASKVELKPLAVSEAEITDQVRRLGSGQRHPFPAALASELFGQLFGLDWQQNLNGIDHLLLVPEEPLTRLGFPVLLTRPPQQAELALDADASMPWLARRFDIVVLPRLSAVPALGGLRGRQR